MNTTGQSMKEAIVNGNTLMGISMMFYSLPLIEMFGRLGFKWVLLDCEHGSLSLSEVENMAIAARSAGIHSIARPRTNSPADITAVLDRGVTGVQVPHITTREEAQLAINAALFHPLGNRSLAIGTRASEYGISVETSDYVSASNNTTVIALQIEDKEAVDNIDDILDTENVDIFFVGPSDLSESLGYPGKAWQTPVREIIFETLEKICGRGRVPGIAAPPTMLPEMVGLGCQYIYTHVNTVLSEGVKKFDVMEK